MSVSGSPSPSSYFLIVGRLGYASAAAADEGDDGDDDAVASLAWSESKIP